jgi:RCC1 and BTB domain-containing protein
MDTASGSTSREDPRYTQTAGAAHNGEMKLENSIDENSVWLDSRLETLPESIAIYTWGRGEDGQLGLGDTNDQHEPVLVDLPGTVKQISCGSGHTVILDRKGQVFTWGRGDDGRLGHGDNGWKYVPRLVEALAGKQIQQVTCGSYHTAAVSYTGELFTWGGGMYGKLGHGDENGHAVPKQVLALSSISVVQVACGSRHTVVLTQSLEVYSWGDKENGVAGHNALEMEGHQYAPRVVAGLRGVNCTQVAACGFHTAALTDTGEIFTWGEGKFGRLGHGCERNQPTPKMIQGPLTGKHVAQVVCGGFHTAAITNDGELYTWGGGEHGQLGHGDKVNKTVPWLVASLTKLNLVQITCGWSHTVALTEDGKVFTWGNGDHGKLGHGSSTKVTTPKLVESLRDVHVCRIASYNEHTAALTSTESSLAVSNMVSTLVNDYSMVVNDSKFSDVNFVIEGQIIHAHKIILAARSQHFNAMFSSGMKESTSSEIEIPNIKYQTFLALMNYLYSDHITSDPIIAIELYAAADMFVLDRLKYKCADMVQQQLNIDNSCTLLCIADNMHANQPREIIMKFICEHFDNISKMEHFQSLSKNLIIEILSNR